MTHSELAQSLEEAVVAVGQLDLENIAHTDSQAILAAIQALNDNATYRQMLVNVIWEKQDNVI